MATFAPHVERAVNEINNRFPALGPGGTYPNHGEDEPGGLPEEFYSADFWSTVKSVHDEAFYWIIANARRLGLKYVISWDRIWSVARADEGVRRYERDANNDGVLSASERHTNHVHTTFDEDPPPGFEEEEEDMPTSQDIAKAVLAAKIDSKDPGFDGWTVNHILDWSARNGRTLTRAVAALASGQKVAQADLDAIQAALEEHDNPAAATRESEGEPIE